MVHANCERNDIQVFFSTTTVADNGISKKAGGGRALERGNYLPK
jgi:hypothetical protein